MIYKIILLPIFLYSDTFTIASYNVQNLFDMRFDGTEYEQFIPNEHNWTKNVLNIKLNNISDVICDLNADIISLQEIENSNAFNLLKDRLKLVGCEYKYSAITHNEKSSIQVSLLSKYPLINIHELKTDRDTDRYILQATAIINNYKLILFANHWKAKSRGGFESRRVSYANSLVKNLPKNAEYIILGDFNTKYNEFLNLKKKYNNTNGIVGINHILKTVDNNKLITKNTIKNGLYYNLWLEVPVYHRWSVNFYGNKDAIDSIILPSTLFDFKNIDYLDKSFRVFKPYYLFTKEHWVNRWQYKHKKHQGKGYSDHFPIYAKFTFF